MVAAVVGSGCCNTASKHGAASVPPNVGDDYGLFFYVGGEVKYPSRQIMGGRITLLKAIACAGGFTLSANKKKIELTSHDGHRRIINCTNISRAEEDVDIHPGDYIYVLRAFWK